MGVLIGILKGIPRSLGIPRDFKKESIGTLGIPRDSKKESVGTLGIPRDSNKEPSFCLRERQSDLLLFFLVWDLWGVRRLHYMGFFKGSFLGPVSY